MSITVVNRYKQLLASIPRGSFYDSDGQVVPLRSSPYSLRITTSFPNRELGLFVNGQYGGIVTTDIDGLATVSSLLQKGSNTIQLIDATTQQVTTAHLTTRDYATWLASSAEIIENIDVGIEQVLLDARLATSSIGLIETVFGQTVGTGNNFGYDVDTYREFLQELRTAYRYFGATKDGVARVVRAFTQTSPLEYPRSFGPRWILGKDMLSPKEDTSSCAYYTTSPLTNINAGGAGVSITNISSTVGVGTGTVKYYDYDTAPDITFSWTPPNGTEGAQVPVASNGTYTLYGGNYFDPIISIQEPFDIVNGLNDQMTIEIDGLGPLQFVMPLGPAVASATIVAAINAAFNADLRYGSAYASVASTYDPYASGFQAIALTTPNAATNGSVTIHTSPISDAAQSVFDVPTNRGGVGSVLSATLLQLTALTNMAVWPTSVSVTNPLKVLVGVTRFHLPSPNIPSAGSFSGNSEYVYVTNVDHTLKQLTLAAPGLVLSHGGTDLVSVDAETSYTRGNVQKSRSITVTIPNITLLPDAFGPTTYSDVITIAGSGAPDTWVMTTNAGAATAALPFQKHTYFAQDRDLAFDIGSNNMVSIPVPNEILSYAGFSVDVSVWGRPDDPTRPPLQTQVSRIGLSFDNQATYTYITPTVLGYSVNATWQPYQYFVQHLVPIAPTRMWVQVQMTNGHGNFTVDKVRVTVQNSHDGLFLGTGTIPRNETKIKQGEILYVWSPNQLLQTESVSLGIASDTNSIPGHIDTIAPTQTWFDKFDVSQYDMSGNGINIIGAFTDSDFLVGANTNLNLALRTPPRFSHLDPSVISTKTDTLVLPTSGPFIGVLSLSSDQNLLNATLFENGIPVTQDQWTFLSANQIQLLFTPLLNSTYTFRYSVLLRFESAVLDLGLNFADYLWFADYHVFLRPEIVPQLVNITAPIQFNATGVATLIERSNSDQTTATLTENTGLNTRIIPPNQWNFVNNQTIRLAPSILNLTSLYTLGYTAEVNHPNTVAQALVEIRSGTSAGAAMAASYNTVTQNQVVGNTNRYHQMRVTLSNIRDIRDARIQSVLLKGLDEFGTGGHVPVLRP